MKKLFSICLVLIVCLSFTSCNLSINTVDTLMRPPKLSGESNLLQIAFEDSLENPETVVMKNPINGDNRSSFLFYDVDGDKVEEGFAFYSDPSIDDIAYISIFKKTNDSWTLVSNIKGRGEEIYEFDFADINGDNVLEIIVSWTFLSDKEKSKVSFSNISDRVLTVYKYTSDEAFLLTTEYFTQMYVDDFNNDKSDEILLLNINHLNVGNRTTARLISFDNEYTVENDIALTLSNMLNVYNIVTDNIDGHTRIFIDGAINENTLITEVIDINHEDFAITLPLYETNTSENPLTLRSLQILSLDIDNDGVVEIPTYENMPNSFDVTNGTDDAIPMPLTVWSEINENKLTVDFKCMYNISYNYFYEMPAEWVGEVYVTYNSGDSILTFYNLDTDNLAGSEIISFRVFNINEWREYNGEYTKFNEDGVFVYAYKLDNSLDHNESLLLKNFVIVN